jgi:hypothetical protein
MGWIVEMVPFQHFLYALLDPRYRRTVGKRFGWLPSCTRGVQLNQKLNNFGFVGGIKVILVSISLEFVFIKTSNCAQAVAIYLLPFSPNVQLSKRLAGSPKELKLIPTCPTLTKVLPKHTHSYIH